MGTSTQNRPLRSCCLAGSLCCLAMLSLAGCGGSKSPSATGTAEDAASNSQGSPTVATSGQPTDAAAASSQGVSDAQQAEAALPKEGSPEWILGQMIVMRAAPLPEVKTPGAREAGLRERNQKLIEMANQVIGKTHKDKSKESIFTRAVQFLVESRFQLAISGTADDAKNLRDDATDLYNRDPSSPAAAEAAFAVARLAHYNARRLAKTERRAIQEFAVQAKLFAGRFPNNDSRAVQLLFAAGQTCELYHLDSDAVSCYAMLEEKYPQTPQSEQAEAILRRLELKGKRLQFGGETPDGGFVKIEQFRGKPVLIVFWISDSEAFQEMVPKLKSASRAYEKAGLTVLGVCLDESETSMDAFVEKFGLNWTQIFYADQAKRHWDHPLAQHYGVHDVPCIWLVNGEGVVVDTHVTPESLDGQLRFLIASGSRQAPQ